MTRPASALPVLLAAACATAPSGPVTFETSAVRISSGADTVGLMVEIARSDRQLERGLASRARLAADRGMLFLFSEPRTPDDGFWMWNTGFALDIAFIDEAGTIRQILGMEPCEEEMAEDCPAYFPEVGYRSALEVNSGWFERNGVGVGASVVMSPMVGGRGGLR